MWIAGLLFSKFLQSISLVAMSLVFLLVENKKENIVTAAKNLIAISLIGIGLIYLISIINSANHQEYWNVVKNKIPFIFLPISLISINYLEKKQLKFLQYFFILCCLISSFWSYFQYLQNIQLYTKLYTQGEVIPTLIHHVSFSILLCIAALFSINNIVKGDTKFIRLLNIISFLWLAYFIHILSVRTGIVLFYLSIFLYALLILVQLKKPIITVSLLLFILFSAYLSYQHIPTIKSKIDYTYYGIAQYKNQQDTSNQVSDTRRMVSDKIGIKLIQKNKLLGVGFGDIKEEMKMIYQQQYPTFKEDVYSRIHNEYLYVLASVGVILGSIFCILLLLPFIQFIRDKNIVFSIVYLLFLLVMLWEPFLENQVGTSIFLVLISLGFLDKNKE